MLVNSMPSRRVVPLAARTCSAVPRQLPTPWQLLTLRPALREGSLLSASPAGFQRGLLPCWVAETQQPAAGSSDEEPIPRWAQTVITAVEKAAAAAEKAAAAAEKEASKTREMLGVLLEVAVHDIYARLGVRGAGAILQSVDDVLQFVLPCGILLTAAQDQEFYRDLRTAITASLLYKDTGFLNAVIVLLKGEGMEKEAGEVEAVLLSGTGIEVVARSSTGPKAKPQGLHIVQQCLQAVESRAKAKGYDDDIRQMFMYCSAKDTQARAELLETTLFVRCVAATLLGACTGVLVVDAGAGMGCEVDEGAGALRLRAGETKYSAEEMDAANEQLQALFLVAAFTLNKVLAAAAAAPAASKARAALEQLPDRFIMDGFCVYAGKASEQQLQRRKATADRRTEAGASVIGEGGLQSAVLQVHFLRARYMPR